MSLKFLNRRFCLVWHTDVATCPESSIKTFGNFYTWSFLFCRNLWYSAVKLNLETIWDDRSLRSDGTSIPAAALMFCKVIPPVVLSLCWDCGPTRPCCGFVQWWGAFRKLTPSSVRSHMWFGKLEFRVEPAFWALTRLVGCFVLRMESNLKFWSFTRYLTIGFDRWMRCVPCLCVWIIKYSWCCVCVWTCNALCVLGFEK